MKVKVTNNKITIMPELNSDQQNQYEVLQWLVGHGPRATGRTYLLALAFIHTALNNSNYESGQVHIFDHSPTHNHRWCIIKEVLEILQKIKSSMEKDEECLFTINYSLNKNTMMLRVELERKLTIKNMT